MNTQMWKIAKFLSENETKKTNLERQLDKLSKQLGIITLGIIVIVFLVYYFSEGINFTDAFLTAVALAVAAIPEWLPAVVTIALAMGVSRMAKKM